MKHVISFVAFTLLMAAPVYAQKQNVTVVGAPKGVLERVDGEVILWAIDSDAPNRPVRFIVFENGYPIIEDVTAMPRPDVNRYGFPGKTPGFRAHVPQKSCESPEVRYFWASMYDEETDSWYPMDGLPKSVICWDNMPAASLTAKVRNADQSPVDVFRYPSANVELRKLNEETEAYEVYRTYDSMTGDGMAIDGVVRFWNLPSGDYRFSIQADGHDVYRREFSYDGFRPVVLPEATLTKQSPIRFEGKSVIWNGTAYARIVASVTDNQRVEIRLIGYAPTLTETGDALLLGTQVAQGPFTGKTFDFMVTIPEGLPEGSIIYLYGEAKPQVNPWRTYGKTAEPSQVTTPVRKR